MATAEEKSKTEEQPKAEEDAKTEVKSESEEKPADAKSTSEEASKTETKVKSETPSKSEAKPKANESPNQFVEKHGNKWAVRQEGSDQTTGEFDTRVEAVGCARKLAGEKGGTVYIFRQGEPADA